MNLSAIIILGPGQLPDGTMLPWGKSRIDAAYQRFLNTEYPSYIILSGGRKSHFTSEASAMRDFVQNHYPDMLKTLLLEELSIDTLQNAFFTKVIHIDPLEIKQLTIITNLFHMPRVRQIFTNLFNASYQLKFLEAADPEADEKTIATQKVIEKSAIEFNEHTLFCNDININLKTVHSLIFNINPDISLAYKNMITKLQPFFTLNPQADS
ncbi:MAG: hypothetical protein A3F11_04385 [Gammaproteobacteria bacterium RIFCSPHIGHO2_12_FULL_37_14]|nr:MAG: hypothetical protein A3F11_04385 [Gammaproteobacteria bacterium RIFCSPHIGHO2_12_FULL_37_14]